MNNSTIFLDNQELDLVRKSMLTDLGMESSSVCLHNADSIYVQGCYNF